MRFHEVRFPASLSFGSQGGPRRRTEIVKLVNGFEERNSPWADALRRYDAGMGVRSLDDVAALIAFFEARRGQLFGFRWKDWADFKSCPPSLEIAATDQVIGVGDGETTVFDLKKRYVSGDQAYSRPISKPVDGTVKVAVGDRPVEVGSELAIDTGAGRLQFAQSPAEGEQVTAGFEFDVPVRFDTDTIMTSLEAFNAGQVPEVPVVEVRT